MKNCANFAPRKENPTQTVHQGRVQCLKNAHAPDERLGSNSKQMEAAIDTGAELFRQIGYLADDEPSLRKVLEFVQGLVKKRNEELVMTKEEIVADLKAALEEHKLNEEGKLNFISWEEFRNELRKEGCYH